MPGSYEGGVPGSADGDEEPPFGLPVLDEVPDLALVLEDLVVADRAVCRAIEGLVRLQEHAICESTTGLPVERWLAAIAKRTGSDRRMLATAAAACRRLPSLRAAFNQARISWAQVRAVALKVRRLPRRLDDRVDAAVAEAIWATTEADPDSVCKLIGMHLAAIEAAHAPDPQPDGAPERDWLAMQPRLDASGGEVHGDFGAEGFALLDATLNAGTPPGAGRTRAGIGTDVDPDAAQAHAGDWARHRAQRLKDLCAGHLPPDHPHHADDPDTGDRHAGCEVPDRDGDGPGCCDGHDACACEDRADRQASEGADGDGDGGGETGTARAGGVVGTTILRADLDTLLGTAPGALLTRLTGGRLHVDAATARRLMDTYGTRLRIVLVDDGRVVGVGRASRQPPGWLADALLAVHDTCSEPGCDVAARACDVDHARPWAHPDRPGRTDVDQLAPLCATANHDKERAGWQVTQTADGVRIWTHARTGLTTSTLPATWQPPPRPHHSDGDGGGSDPPHDPRDGDGSDPPECDTGPPSDPPYGGGADPPEGGGVHPPEQAAGGGADPPDGGGADPPLPRPHRPGSGDPDDLPF